MARPDRISTSVTRLYDVSLPTKRRAVAASQGQDAQVEFQLLDNTGNPVDISVYGEGPQGPQGPQDAPTVIVRIKEVITTRSGEIQQVECEVTDATTGLVTFPIPERVANNAGVYIAEFAVLKTSTFNARRKLASYSGNVAFTNTTYLWIDRGLFGDSARFGCGPPRVDEIRLYVRDNAPEENRLLDEFEFDLAEICHATELGVRYWNESQPPIRVNFDTRNYPVRDRWLQCIAGQMLMMAAHRFRRNHLPYSAAGISVDDQNKFQIYDQAGMQMVADYREWVKQKRVAINLQMAITSSGSLYGKDLYSLLSNG